MKWLGSAAEFGLVAGIGLMLTMQAAVNAPRRAGMAEPSAGQVTAAVEFAEREAERVNGSR